MQIVTCIVVDVRSVHSSGYWCLKVILLQNSVQFGQHYIYKTNKISRTLQLCQILTFLTNFIIFKEQYYRTFILTKKKF